MGIGQSIGSNMKKNMEAQMNFQKQLILKQRQTQLAMQIALGRQRLQYYKYFFYTSSILLISRAMMTKNPLFLGPLLPLSFVYAFQYDMFYGDMLIRARKQAEEMILNCPQKFYLPENSGIVSLAQYEHILNIKKQKKEPQKTN